MKKIKGLHEYTLFCSLGWKHSQLRRTTFSPLLLSIIATVGNQAKIVVFFPRIYLTVHKVRPRSLPSTPF